MILVRELNAKHIEEIKSLYAEIFTNKPWNDDWGDEKRLHEYIMDLIGNRLFKTSGGIFEMQTDNTYFSTNGKNRSGISVLSEK